MEEEHFSVPHVKSNMSETEQHIGVCLIAEKDSSILLGKRINSFGSGSFGMPGGRVNVGEKLEDAGIRELAEETGLEADKLQYVGVVRENQGNYDFIHFIFQSLIEGDPKVLEPDKCEEWIWFPKDGLPENILRGHRAAIDLYLNQEGIIDII